MHPLPMPRAWGALDWPASIPSPARQRRPFWPSASKSSLSRRIILAIEGRQCVLDSFSDVFPSDCRKKPLSGRIIPVIEGCQCLPKRINRCPVERRGRDRRITNFMISAGLPGRGAFLRLNRRPSDLRNYCLRVAFTPGAR